LIDSNADLDSLNRSSHVLQPGQYEEVIIERCHEGRCGYPPCKNKLTSTKVGAKYRISRVSQSVYDMSEGIRYCNEVCAEASEAFKLTLSSDPIQLRLLDLNLVKKINEWKPKSSKDSKSQDQQKKPIKRKKKKLQKRVTFKSENKTDQKEVITAQSSRSFLPHENLKIEIIEKKRRRA